MRKRKTKKENFLCYFLVSLDDSQVWALDAKRNLLKLDRLTVLFKK